MAHPVYFDYAATTPVDRRVAERMVAFLTEDGVFGNPASRSHGLGWQAEEAVEHARAQVAQLIGADPREIVFTSGATEADNLALKGVFWSQRAAGKDHIVTSRIEHKAVLDSCHWLESQGARVTYLEPDRQGRINADDLAAALTPNTALVSLMHVNNEVGSINDLAALGKVVHDHGTLFHVDGAQGVGKLPLDLAQLPVDLLSISAHKVYGPKGIGALYVRRKPGLQLIPLIHGGGHERGMRSGTLPTHQIVGLGEACSIAAAELHQDAQRLSVLRERLVLGIAQLPGAEFSVDPATGFPGILNIHFPGLDGEALLLSLARLAVSSGSACNSATLEPSYVLTALGLPRDAALSAIRLSIGRYTTDADIDLALAELTQSVTRLRAV